MQDLSTIVYVQPVMVSEPLANDFYPQASDGYSQVMQSSATIPEITSEVPVSERQIVRTIFSSVPMISRAELVQEYRELGEALNEMIELEDGDEWKIDPPVYIAASYIAASLMASSYPAPHVFSHGSKSVVYSWVRDNDSLYLTVSADKISALISSPERIKRRIEIGYTSNDLGDSARALYSLRAGHPILLPISVSVLDPPEIIGV